VTQSSTPRIRIRTQSGVALVALLVLAAALVGVAALGMEALGDLRAYVGGESLWSRAQKNAAYELARYAGSNDEAQYRAFLASLDVPLGDRRAREELDRTSPDLSAVRADLIAGGNDPADVPGMIRLYRRFRHVGYMARAVEIWRAGDDQITAQLVVGTRLHALVEVHRADARAVETALATLDRINNASTRLEGLFSGILGAAARWVRDLVLVVMLGAAGLLVAVGILLAERWFRRASEAARGQALETLRAAIEAAPVAIYSLGLEGEVRLWNRAAERIFGWSAAELVGRALPAALSGAADEGADPASRTGATRNVMRRQRRDGRPVEVSVTSSPTYTLDGRITGMMSVALDVSDVRRLEEQLRQAQKMEAVGRLAAGIAHDFNNLLTAILGFTDLLVEDLEQSGGRREEAEEIRRAALRAVELTRQLLAFGRQQVLAPQQLDLNDVVGGIERLVRRLVGEDIDVRTALAADLGTVRADPSQLEQVIVNLAVNARDAMRAGGRLTIETANVELDRSYFERHPLVPPGPYVLLAVTDTGSGMDPETVGRVFEPFFTTKPKGTGTGLGLSTVYGIVKQSGGFIWVYSEVDHGTTIKVYLPRTFAAPSSGRTAEEPVISLRGSETVLVVEDQPELRELARRVLTGHGYQVLVAADGVDALKVAERTGRIDLLVTDVIMPGMGGREVALLLGAARPELKVLYVSGYPDESIVHHGVLEAGIAFLQKPFSADGLARKVRQVLDEGQPPAADRGARIGSSA